MTEPAERHRAPLHLKSFLTVLLVHVSQYYSARNTPTRKGLSTINNALNINTSEDTRIDKAKSLFDAMK